MEKLMILDKTSMLNSFDLKYKAAIEEIAKNKSSLRFNNSGPVHASIVISNIYKYAEKIVRIYANDLNGEISAIGNYFEELNNFVNKGKILKVIVDVPPNPESNAFAFIKHQSKGNNKVQIKIASPDFKRDVQKKYNSDTHFTVGDDRMFRVEYNNSNHQAYCGYNDKKYALQLETLFDKHFDNCYSLRSTKIS